MYHVMTTDNFHYTGLFPTEKQKVELQGEADSDLTKHGYGLDLA